MERNPLDHLIARCAEMCGGQNALARRIGVGKSFMCDVKAHRVPMTSAVLASLCEVANLDAEEARKLLAELECVKQPDPEKAKVMRRAFFRLLALGAVFCGLAATNVSSYALSVNPTAIVTVYTLCLLSLACVASRALRAACFAAGVIVERFARRASPLV